MIEPGASGTDVHAMPTLPNLTSPYLAVSLLALAALTACPASDEPPPSIQGKSAEDAADITTESTCNYVARCGLAVEVCATPESQEPNEDGSIDVDGECKQERMDLTIAECEDEFAADIAEAYACAELTPAIEQQIDDCLAQLSEQTQCLTVEDVTEDPTNFGEDELQAPAFPELCAELFTELGSCTVMTGQPIEPTPDD